MTDRPKEAGFTLLELLITITLVSFLSVMVFGGLRFGIRTWERTQGESTAVEEIQVAQGWIRRVVASTYPNYVAADPKSPRVEFSGSSDEMSFLGPSAFGVNQPGRARIRLRSVQAGNRVSLVVSEQPELARGPADAEISEELVHGLASIRFSYFGQLDAGKDVSWHEAWVGQRHLPALVRIAAEYPPGVKSRWPALYVEPRISTDASCILDPLTRSCRGR